MTDRDVVRQAVDSAERLRRARAAVRWLAVAAPFMATIVCAIALLAFVRGWEAWTIVVTLAAGAALVAGGYAWHRRAASSGDALAHAIDRQASLQGELRSAHWFAVRDDAAAAEDVDQRAWLDLHLSRAASSLPAINWDAVFPRVDATRNWVASAVLVLATIALAIGAMPRHIAVQKARTEAALAAAGIAVPPGLVDELSPEMRKQLADLLAAINTGNLKTADANQKLSDLSQKISPLDPRFAPMLKDLAKRLQEAAARKEEAERTAAGRSEKGTQQPSEDVKAAAEELADKLNSSTGAKPGESANGQSKSGQSGQSSDASNQSPTAASVQLSQMSASDNGQMMMTGTGSMTGDSRSGAGGHGSPPAKGAGAEAIAKALKQETIEAATEAPGENVSKEDIRRKTTQGTSAMSFSHAAPAATYDTSHAVGTPVVPDARRALLQRYFIRREP